MENALKRKLALSSSLVCTTPATAISCRSALSNLYPTVRCFTYLFLFVTLGPEKQEKSPTKIIHVQPPLATTSIIETSKI